MIFKRVKKLIAWWTLGFFIATQTVQANPAAGISMAVPYERPAFLKIDIPENLATIDGIFEAPYTTVNRLVLHIQNAHANYGAQTKINELLQYLYKTYGFKTVFVEGAAEELDPKYLRMFPDSERNRKLAKILMEQGEMTGVEMFVFEEAENKGQSEIKALGIETPELYRKNYEALKKVFEAEATARKYLTGIEARLETLSSRIFPADSRRILSEWKKFEKGEREFMPFIQSLVKDSRKFLNVDLESLFAQVAWPQIARLLQLQQMEKDLNEVSASQEKEQLVKFLEEKHVDRELVGAIKNFQGQRVRLPLGTPESEFERSPPRELTERLYQDATPYGFKFSQYPNFSVWAGYQILKSELDPKSLFSEIRLIFQNLLDSLANTEIQKNLLALLRDSEQVRKLLSLELTRAEWKGLLQKRDEVEMDGLLARLRGIGAVANKEYALPLSNFENKKVNEEFHSKVSGIYEAAFDFYDAAYKREDVFYEKIDKAMTELKTQKAVVVTGGFHTDGMTQLLRENEVSYGVLTPRLMEKSNENLYRTVMLQNRPAPFEVSYLEAKSILQSWAAQSKQVGIIDLKPILLAIGKAGNLGDVAEAIEIFNNSDFAKDAGIKIERQEKDVNGKPTYIVFKIARLHTFEGFNWRIDGLDEAASSKNFYYHGGMLTGSTLDNVDMDHLGGQQNKKGRSYGGFYLTNETSRYWSEQYARLFEDNGLFRLRLRDGAKIFRVVGKADIDRLNKETRDALREAGYAMIVGKDVLNRFQAVLLDKSAVVSFEEIKKNEGAAAEQNDLGATARSDTRVDEKIESAKQIKFWVKAFGLAAFLFAAAVVIGSGTAAAYYSEHGTNRFNVSEYSFYVVHGRENIKGMLKAGALFVSNANPINKEETDSSGWVRSYGEKEHQFNPNRSGSAMAKAFFLLDANGRGHITSVTTKNPDEFFDPLDFPHAFQSGPMVIENGELNPRLESWHKGNSQRRVVLGVNGRGDVFVKDFFGYDHTGYYGPSWEKLKKGIEEWQAQNGIRFAMAVDGGRTGVFPGQRNPITAFVAVKKSASKESVPYEESSSARSESRPQMTWVQPADSAAEDDFQQALKRLSKLLDLNDEGIEEFIRNFSGHLPHFLEQINKLTPETIDLFLSEIGSETLKKALTINTKFFLSMFNTVDRLLRWYGKEKKEEKIEKLKKILNDSNFNFNEQLIRLGKELVVHIYETAGVNAARGLLQILGLDARDVPVVYEGVDPQRVSLFKKATRKETAEKKTNQLAVGFADGALVNLGPEFVVLPYDPLKYQLPQKISPEERNARREQMGIKNGRKVIAVSSPSIDSMQRIVEEYLKFPEEERPLLVFAPRGFEDEFAKRVKELLAERNVKVGKRDYSDEINKGDFMADGKPMGDFDVVVLATQGEFLKFLSVADLALIERNRNLFEPASQGVPILYFDGYWGDNVTAQTLLDMHGGAIKIDEGNLFNQMEEALNDPEKNIQGGKAALKAFNEEFVPFARFSLRAILLMNMGVLDTVSEETEADSILNQTDAIWEVKKAFQDEVAEPSSASRSEDRLQLDENTAEVLQRTKTGNVKPTYTAGAVTAVALLVGGILNLATRGTAEENALALERLAEAIKAQDAGTVASRFAQTFPDIAKTFTSDDNSHVIEILAEKFDELQVLNDITALLTLNPKLKYQLVLPSGQINSATQSEMAKKFGNRFEVNSINVRFLKVNFNTVMIGDIKGVEHFFERYKDTARVVGRSWTSDAKLDAASRVVAVQLSRNDKDAEQYVYDSVFVEGKLIELAEVLWTALRGLISIAQSA